jgi:hypothetical protein
MTQRIDIAGIRARVIDPNLGAGGQGRAMLVELEDWPGIKMAAKEMVLSQHTEQRLRWLCQKNLARLSPAFAAPIICETTGDGKILHLAPLAEAVPQDEDPARALPHNLQICLEFICLLQILKENGLSHGDIAPSNLLIAPDGSVYLIDFDGFLAFDPDVPAPDTIGQRPMLAPEQRNGTQPTPTRESGYFQVAMMMSMILTGRYPTEGMPSEPNAVDQVICQGRWPEHDRPVCPDDLPIAALGIDLMGLFDRAFSLNPANRPGPDEWRRALTRALHNCWIHDCGEAFVADANTAACPGCGHSISLPKASRQLKLQVLPSGPRYGIELVDQKPIVLGRTPMPGLPPTVSGRHLQILPFKNKLLLRHVGSNPTYLQRSGQWYLLTEVWVDLPDQSTPIHIRLAASDIRIQ